jgi:hypothetical protein
MATTTAAVGCASLTLYTELHMALAIQKTPIPKIILENFHVMYVYILMWKY